MTLFNLPAFDLVGSEQRYDAVLVGAGIMSATLAVLLKELDPDLRILIVEKLEAPALESSASQNNAGTGHAANCELNYTPLLNGGNIQISKALAINNAFEQSLEFWASLTEQGKINPETFFQKVPHISFVWGKDNVGFLHKRYKAMSSLTAFSEMEWSADRKQLHDWMPLVMEERDMRQTLAATKVARGSDIDFGNLTNAYLRLLQANGSVEVRLSSEVVGLKKNRGGSWNIKLKTLLGGENVYAPFVFLGAGGNALSLLQKSEIPESVNYAGFPVSGQWLVCSNKSIVNKHNSKVYGKAKVGAPPMSVPHLDSRWIDGQKSLLFGPFAGFTTKFLKRGSRFDLLNSIRKDNLSSMLQVGVKNFSLVKYLANELVLSDEDRINSLRQFFPTAQHRDWSLSIAGQRVQIIKKTSRGGTLQMGTEVVTSSDGTLAALLGASPGASTAVSIMLEVLEKCWKEQMSSLSWQGKLKAILPNFDQNYGGDESLLLKMKSRNNYFLNLN